MKSNVSDELRRAEKLSYDQGQWEQSLTLDESLLDIEPQSVQAWLFKARCLVQLGRWSAAREAFAQTVRLDLIDLQATDLCFTVKTPG